ncbi:MAG: DNA-3-methyladenine glycosylase I [Burkholderiales bacterium]|nr:MAG: DNA-3-methyladenine glycosylase I [Burkholderiales bacterium]
MSSVSHPLRCPWCGTDPLYVDYHDKEWGVPVHDEKRHFEFLTLEAAQAGLSWITILRKRENYRKAFADFDAQKVALFGKDKVETLLQDAGIVRNRLKIESAISNAGKFLDICAEFGSWDAYFWRYTEGRPVINHWKSMSELPASTPLSDRISGELKKRGFRFTGTTIMYAHMQAIGMVNDHLTTCFLHPAYQT